MPHSPGPRRGRGRCLRGGRAGWDALARRPRGQPARQSPQAIPNRGAPRRHPGLRTLLGLAAAGLLIWALLPSASDAATSAAWWFLGVQTGTRRQLGVREAESARTPSRPAAAAWIDLELEARLRAGVPAENGALSFWVRNLATGATASHDADRLHPAASLFKLPVMVETLAQYRAGKLRLSEELTITQEQWTDGAGVLQAQVGTRQSVERLLNLMMGVSDNIAALTLLDRIGREQVNALALRLALPATRIHTRSLATDPLAPDEPNRTSARDVGTLLELLARGRLFDPETTDLALELMQQGRSSDWLGPGLPANVPLAHKSGELPAVRHDCGIAFVPNGPLVICVLTSDLRDQDLAAESIATIARLSYQHFSRP